MKIGIFGGCFNPPHNMHKSIALKLIDRGYVDKVIFVPTGNNYKRKSIIDFDHRFNMLKLITMEDYLDLSGINNNKKYKYTYQVLDYFKDIYKDDSIYFICGEDNLLDLFSWTNYQYLLENYKVLVVKRSKKDLSNILNKYYDYRDNIIISNIEEDLISSTKIRSLLFYHKYNLVLDLMDCKVLDYIRENKLYE